MGLHISGMNDSVSYTSNDIKNVISFIKKKNLLGCGASNFKTVEEAIRSSKKGDYFIRGICGEIYICGASIFNEICKDIGE